MTSLVKIPMDSASTAQLRYYAATVLGLDIPNLQNTQQLIGKILNIKPDATHIEVPEEMAGETQQSATAPQPALTEAGVPLPDPDPNGPLHPTNDPRVTIIVQNSSDKTKPAECFINVNGYVIRIKRGEQVAIPYRHFLALENGIEMIARETGDINPMTGMPIMTYSEQPSYPYSVIDRPSPEVIAAWHKRTDGENRKLAA